MAAAAATPGCRGTRGRGAARADRVLETDPRPPRRAFRWEIVGLLAGLAGCHQAPEPRLPAVDAPAGFPHEAYVCAPGREVFALRPHASEVVVAVGRGGWLGGWLGHEHVVASTALAGYADPARGVADVYLAAGSLEVDEPPRRRARGLDPEGRSAAQREATRANMLSARLLDAERFPFIVARVEREPAGAVRLTLTVAGRIVERGIPLTVRTRGRTLLAETRFTTTHGALGLAPYSILGGLVRVADALEIAVSITADARCEV